MSTRTEFRGTATSLRTEGGVTIGRYHNTDIIKFDSTGIILNSGGFRTVTTKKRLNAASIQFGLGFAVYQKNHEWFVDLPNGDRVDFEDGMDFERADGHAG